MVSTASKPDAARAGSSTQFGRFCAGIPYCLPGGQTLSIAHARMVDLRYIVIPRGFGSEVAAAYIRFTVSARVDNEGEGLNRQKNGGQKNRNK